MNIFYFFQRYLNRLPDNRFVHQYERLVLHRLQRFFGIMVSSYFILLFLLGFLVSISNGFFTVFIVVVIGGLLLGAAMVKQTLQFLATNNQRYMMAKMKQEEATFSYDNVI